MAMAVATTRTQSFRVGPPFVVRYGSESCMSMKMRLVSVGLMNIR